jgi:hypothetical protein
MNGYCEECQDFVDAKRVPDGPDFCPECRCVDTIDYDREEDE